MSKSRQLREPIDEKSSGLPEGQNYCRKCQRIRPSANFGRAVDGELDSNGLLSICKDCTNILYERALSVENGSIQKAVLSLCRKLNIRYDERAINSALQHIQSKGSDPLKIFNLYRAKLLVILRENVNDTLVDLSYQHENNDVIEIDESKFANSDVLDMDELRKFWGKGFEPEEIMILEEKFAEYSQTNSIDTHPEKVLLKYVCLKEYEIDKELSAKGKSSTATLTKEYQELLKSANISPASTAAASVGKAQETWGMFIKTIEEKEPAEVFKDDGLFKDYDNIEHIWNKYVVRSIKNFITGSRDFNVEEIESDYDDEEDSSSEETPPLEYKAEE